MKWFFALNDEGDSYPDLLKMAQVAVHSAQKNTSLEPYLIYDGKDAAFIDWMKKHSVTVIERRSFVYNEIKEIAERRGDKNILGIGAGAFLRTEIPALSEELAFDDEYVLYTDVDVMFLGEVTDYLEKLSPRFFAVAPEFHKHDYKSMNSGVMLMNLTSLREKDPAFRQYIKENIEALVSHTWDQTAYIKFYSTWFGYKWNKLKPEYNWKTYWEGYQEKAKILHFHGPKPYQRPLFKGAETAPRWKPLLPLLTKQYDELCQVWDKFYLEVTSEI